MDRPFSVLISEAGERPFWYGHRTRRADARRLMRAAAEALARRSGAETTVAVVCAGQVLERLTVPATTAPTH